MFPNGDKFWEDVRNFIDHNKNSEDIIIGPTEFFEVIPSIIPDFILKYDNRFEIGEKELQIDWFIVHKGMLNNINLDVIKLVISTFRPVLANDVFIVFARFDKNLPEIDKNTDHYRALIIEIEKKNLGKIERKEIKNVIMISIDNLRFDCIGYQPDKNELIEHDVIDLLETPTLDAIASKSICFTQAISTAPYTTTSHASIITGLYPPRHGVRAFYDTKLSESVQTLAEIFQKEGYITILATDVPELWNPLDLDRGFSNMFVRDDKKLFEFLDQNKNKKIFLFVHFFDVHEPFGFSEYEICKGYNSDYYKTMEKLCRENNVEFTQEKPHITWNRLINNVFEKDINILLPLYVKGVSKFDKGRFKEFIKNLEYLEFLKNSLLAIFSDHGEGRDSVENPNFFSHGGTLYDSVIRVPLMIYCEVMKPKMVNNQVSTVDIFPTILNLVFGDISMYYQLDGKNLVYLIEGKDIYDSIAYSEVWRANEDGYISDNEMGSPVPNIHTDLQWLLFQRCIRTKENKYMIYGKPEILDKGYIIEDKNFMIEFYRCLLLRFETEEELKYYDSIIDKLKILPQEFLNIFLKSEEYKNRFVIYDLVYDLKEENPRFIQHDLSKSFILNIEKLNIVAKKIFSKSMDGEEKIKERLKSLGYLC